MDRSKKRILINILFFLIIIPICVMIGVKLLDDRKYNIISLCIVILSCVPFYYAFEKKVGSTRRMVLIAVMIALSVTGRFLFAALPGFKPVTAIVILTGIYFGSEAGFLTGSFTAILSNIYFGQGPWTPFQMFVWGFIGFIAGLPILKELFRKSRIAIGILGIFCGILYSMLMDIWTVLSMDGTFRINRYLVTIGTSAPYTAIYAISNIIFLWIIMKPIGKKLDRIIMKYDI